MVTPFFAVPIIGSRERQQKRPTQAYRGDQILRRFKRGGQLPDPPVAAGEFAQQPPPQRIGDQPYEPRRRRLAC